jgi:hypothetical protein
MPIDRSNEAQRRADRLCRKLGGGNAAEERAAEAESTMNKKPLREEPSLLNKAPGKGKKG